uniref:Uncharacterized protein n=1 Tax=Panagrolaimus sp. JU765 TaxID=591449 RepID=A0AC34RFT4_9BILA
MIIKLRDVFAGGEMPEPFQISNSLFGFGRDQFETRPQIVNNALFSQSGKLTPVYGKPVDIIDGEGAISTVCVWSYPLTSTAALINQRKTSHVLHRSPSVVHLKNQKEVEKANAI